MVQHRVILHSKVKKQIHKIPKKVGTRIVDIITGLKDDPRPHGSIKLKGSMSTYRIRVGNYRIIYEIHDDIVTVVVIKIGHRKDVYNQRQN